MSRELVSRKVWNISDASAKIVQGRRTDGEIASVGSATLVQHTVSKGVEAKERKEPSPAGRRVFTQENLTNANG